MGRGSEGGCGWVRRLANSELISFALYLFQVTLILKERMVKKGSLMVSYASHPCKKLGYFFRLVVKCVPPPTTERMDYIIQEMVAIGGEL